MRPGLWCGHLGACPSYPGWQGQLGAAWCRRSAPVRPAGASWAALPALGSGEASVGSWWGAAVPGCGETTTFINTNCLFKTDCGTTQSAEQGRAPPTGPQPAWCSRLWSHFSFPEGKPGLQRLPHREVRSQGLASMWSVLVPAHGWAWSLVCQQLPLETSSISHEELEQGPTLHPAPAWKRTHCQDHLPGVARQTRPSVWNRPEHRNHPRQCDCPITQ